MENTDNNGLYLSFFGPFCLPVISSMVQHLNANLIADIQSKSKLYKIMIELAQNVALYSVDRAEMPGNGQVGVGTLKIKNDGDYITCTTINKIDVGHASILLENCSLINNSDELQLRKKKADLRKMSTIQDTGAHIGLIVISLTSGLPLEYDVYQKDTNHFFSITASISKHGNES
jgi:hypothetical protein